MRGFWQSTLIMLALATAGARPAEASGAQAVPAWSAEGDLTVTISNFTKLDMRVQSLTVTLAGGSTKACEWRIATPTEVGPTGTYVAKVVGAAEAAACLPVRLRPARGKAPAVRFEVRRPGVGEGAAKAPQGPRLTIDLGVANGDRTVHVTSIFSLVEKAR
jgi:hypothetical protein